MDDEIEIDVKKIIKKLISMWRYIIAVGILAGLTAFVLTYFQPRAYEASAVVALRRPLYQPNFDSRYQTLSPLSLNSKIVADIATADEIVEAVYNEWNAKEKNNESIQSFRDNFLSAKAGEDQSVVFLTVHLSDPIESMRLANFWAEQVVSQLNNIYAAHTQDQINYFKQQTDLANQSLLDSQQKLVEFEKSNKINLLTNELNDKLTLQKELLQRQRLIQYVERDTNTLLKEYASLSAEQNLPQYERNKLLFLQLRVYADSTSTNLSSLQFQLPSIDLGEKITVADMRKEIQAWSDTLKQQSAEIQAKLDTLSDNIFQLQYQIAVLNSQKETLQRNKDIAFDSFTVVSRKYQEVIFSTDDASTDVARIGSQATLTNSTTRGTLRNTALATVSGLLLSIFGVLVWDWWTSEEDEKIPPE